MWSESDTSELKPCRSHIILVNLTMEYSSFDIQKYPTLSVKEGYKEWVNTYDDSVEDEMDIEFHPWADC